MGRSLRIETIAPRDLGEAERGLWAAFQIAQPHLSSPYFDVRFTLAAGDICPGAQVAVLRRGGRIDGFFPFQRRGGLIQPLGAPLADYHGIIGRPGVEFDLSDIVRGLDAKRLRVSGLKAASKPAGAAVHRAMAANLSGGYDAWLEGRRLAGQGDFLKDKRRRMRMLERDHAPVSLAFGADDPGALGYILRLKKEQFASGGQQDVFDCGWTERLLRRLLEHPDPDFGARIAVLRAGDAIIAAEIGLISGSAYHLWFPVYDPAFHRYSPGQLMTLETIRVLAEQGVRTVDFGAGGESYKRAFADPGEAVFEGEVFASPVRAAVSSALGFKAQRLKLGRRIDRIVACEPRLSGRVLATTKYVGVVADRNRGLTAAMGAVGLGVALGMLSE